MNQFSDRVNELEPELLGIHALNSFPANTSSSRSVMMSLHLTQHLVTNGLQEKLIIAGPELEMAKYTLSSNMPADGKIIAVIDKYPVGVDKNTLGHNPETLVIFENMETDEVDCLIIPTFRSFHQYFGWSCQEGKGMDMLRHREYIPKGTVFADTPGVKDGNCYMYGRNMNVAYMAIPGTAEDGIVISRSALEHWKYKIYATRIIQWGSNSVPVNIYGPNKPFPDINEYVREDGLLMALRNYEPDTFAVDMGLNGLSKVNHAFDTCTYAHSGKGRVVDIEIISNNNPIKNIPLNISEQPDKYVQAYVRYNQSILDIERRLRSNFKIKYPGQNLRISPAFNKLIVKAMVITNHNAEKLRQSLKLLYRKESIDEYYAKFVIEYEMTPNIGEKFSNASGSKGVICKIMEDHEMPIRSDGVRADVILDPGPVNHRMSYGQTYEQYVTCASHDVTVKITKDLGLIESAHMEHFEKRPKVTISLLNKINPEIFDKTYAYLMSYYRIFNELMINKFLPLNKEERMEHLCDVINEGCCKVFIPVNNKKLPDQIVTEIEKEFKPTYSTVRYVGPSGKQVETHKKVRIGKVYMFLLDKLAIEWSATSNARLQHFGILSSVTKSEKFAYPYRNSPTRMSGETESRIFPCYTGPETIAEMFDRTNNSVARRSICWNLLTADKPSNIDVIVDRNVIPLGASRPIQIVNHIFNCAGFKPEYLPEVTDAIKQGIEAGFDNYD